MCFFCLFLVGETVIEDIFILKVNILSGVAVKIQMDSSPDVTVAVTLTHESRNINFSMLMMVPAKERKRKRDRLWVRIDTTLHL